MDEARASDPSVGRLLLAAHPGDANTIGLRERAPWPIEHQAGTADVIDGSGGKVLAVENWHVHGPQGIEIDTRLFDL
jgi:hypothetical protein